MAWTVYDQMFKAIRGGGLRHIRDEDGYPLDDAAHYSAPLGERLRTPGLPWVGEFKALGKNKRTPDGTLYRRHHRLYFSEPTNTPDIVVLVHAGYKETHKRSQSAQDTQISEAMARVKELFDGQGWSYPVL